MSFQEIEPKDVEEEGVILAELTCHSCEDTVLRVHIESLDGHDPFALLYSRAKLEGWKYDGENEILVCKKCVAAEE